jgi:hypothetical protein
MTNVKVTCNCGGEVIVAAADSQNFGRLWNISRSPSDRRDQPQLIVK